MKKYCISTSGTNSAGVYASYAWRVDNRRKPNIIEAEKSVHTHSFIQQVQKVGLFCCECRDTMRCKPTRTSIGSRCFLLCMQPAAFSYTLRTQPEPYMSVAVDGGLETVRGKYTFWSKNRVETRNGSHGA